MAFLSFVIRASGTGSVLSSPPIQIGADGSNWIQGEFYRNLTGYLDRMTVSVPVIAGDFDDSPGNKLTLLAAAKNAAASLATSLIYRPPQIVEFTGGATILREAQNWGDLRARSSATGSDSVLFANCTLESIAVRDDENTGGVYLDLVFVRVREGFTARDPGTNDQPFFRFLKTNEGSMPGQTVVDITQVRGALSSSPRFEVTAGGIVRASVRIAYDADFGTRTPQQVGDFIRSLAVALSAKTLEFGSRGYGKSFPQNRSENFGRLEISSTGGSPFTTVLSRCVPESVSLAADYGRAGVVIEVTFAAAMTDSGTRWIRWDRRAGGTGSVLSTSRITPSGEDQSARSAEWRIEDDGVLRRAIVRVYVAGSSEGRTLAQARAYAATLKDAMLWHPPVIRRLARGKAALVNLHQNFGDLVLYNADNEAIIATLLENCTLDSVTVTEDHAEDGVDIEFAFVTIADSVAV